MSPTYKTQHVATTFIAFLAITGCDRGPASGRVTLDRWKQADAEPGQWIGLGRGWQADRFSPLTAINDTNAARIGFAWESDARSRRGRVEHGQEATPIVVDGVLYVSGPWGTAWAVDAKTGQQIWRYDPPVDGSYGRRACCDVVSRGLSVWGGRVYVATLDGWMVALDAATGKEVWKTDTFEDRDTRFYTITGPPIVANRVVVVGNSGGEFGVRGYISAYDIDTGALRWRFYTVPRDPAKGPPEDDAMRRALETWGPETDWASGLGGTVWGEMNYDPELNLLYVGTGNSTPYAGWFRDPSGGDNLYLVSILAIDPDSGALKWHYQQVPWEIWDYTATMNMILADLTIDGRARKVLMQAPKNGFFYVLDRATGEVISGKPYVYVNWASGIDSSGRPILTGKGLYKDRPAAIFPTQAGGHNWQPMAFSRQTGLVYIPARESGMFMWGENKYKWIAGDLNMGAGAMFGGVPEGVTLPPEFARALNVASRGEPAMATREVLLAWDPVAQKERWRVPIGTTEWVGGGVVTTAGNLVIQGTGSGQLIVYRADNGEKLHQIEVGTGIIGAPMSYEVDGEQYIAVMAGFGGALNTALSPVMAATRYENYGRILAFKLGGGATPLPPARTAQAVPEPPAVDWYSDSAATRGAGLYAQRCARCHGGRGEAQLSAYPDLHRLPAEVHAVFDSIVLGGALKAGGMASFADLLTPADARALQSYFIREQRVLYKEGNPAPR